jgi:peptide/nickel transport system substrate-binding protein
VNVSPSTRVVLCLLICAAACQPADRSDPAWIEADPDATARFAVASGITRFDPHRATSGYDNTWLFPVYDRLIHMDPEGNPVPGLATSWEFGEDGRYLDLTLRERVTFHDGSPFDANAVAANIERAKTVSGSSVRPELAAIANVKILDSHRVRFQLHYADAALPLLLSDRAGMMVSPAAFDQPGLDRRGVGAGPFRHVEFRTGNRSIYERFSGYWDPAAAGVQRLELILIANEVTRLNALRSGQIHGAGISPVQIDEARLASLNVQTRIGLEAVYLHLNRTRSKFPDVRVRQAMNLAINRDAIVRALSLGYGEASVQPFPEGYMAYDPLTGRDYYRHDPARARKLLEDAGLGDGFSFELIVGSSIDAMPLLEALQAQLGAVGIQVRPRMLEGAQIAERFLVAQESDAALGTWGGRPDPSQTLSLLFTPGALANPGGHTTPEVQRLADAARREIDPDKRHDLLQAATRQITSEALGLFVYLPSTTYAVRPEVAGMRVWISGSKPEFRGVTIMR